MKTIKMVISRHEIDMLTKRLFREQDNRLLQSTAMNTLITPSMIDNATFSIDIELTDTGDRMLASFKGEP